jgi:hypothetical protein
MEPDQVTETPLFCARCADELQPGGGNFYQVTIEAIADPTPPAVEDAPSPADLREQIENLIAQMEGLSAQEALDQVYRRLTLYLCAPCYQEWIEDPTG